MELDFIDQVIGFLDQRFISKVFCIILTKNFHHDHFHSCSGTARALLTVKDACLLHTGGLVAIGVATMVAVGKLMSADL